MNHDLLTWPRILEPTVFVMFPKRGAPKANTPRAPKLICGLYIGCLLIGFPSLTCALKYVDGDECTNLKCVLSSHLHDIYEYMFHLNPSFVTMLTSFVVCRIWL